MLFKTTEEVTLTKRFACEENVIAVDAPGITC
jgi:hypothetical protein